MITNFIDAWAGGLCRGLNGMIGHYPSTCLNNAGRPALFLAAVAVGIVVVAITVWQKSRG